MLSTDNGIEAFGMFMHAGGAVEWKSCCNVNGMVIPKILRNRVANWSKIPLLCLSVYTEDR